MNGWRLPLRIGELRGLVRDVVLETLVESDNEALPALLDRSGLAKALGVGMSSVDRFRREGMPYVLVGDSPRFEREPCLAWIRARRVSP